MLRHQSARKDTKLPHITIICKNHEFIMTFSIPRGFLLLLGFSLYLESISVTKEENTFIGLRDDKAMLGEANSWGMF